MVDYRTYQPGDEHQIVSLWNACLETDPTNLGRFRRLVLLDANFDPKGLQIAVDGDKIVGVLYGVRRKLPMYGTDLEEDNGWITVFFVDSNYRRQGVGEKLLENAVQFFKAVNRKTVFFASYAPNYIVPGIDKDNYPAGAAFLEKEGFTTVYPCVAMDRNLVGFKLSNEVKALVKEREEEGYTFRQAIDGDLYDVIQFANDVFNPDWGRAIREGVPQGLPMNRIWVAYHNDKLVGFCIHGGYEGVPDRFGPFGVDPSEQGKKLGKILLNLCLYSMKGEGLHGAWFLWTGEKSTAGHLYKKTGFEITRTFHVMKKTIE